MSAQGVISKHFELANEAAYSEVERLARAALAEPCEVENHRLQGFTMAMGTAFFSAQETLGREDDDEYEVWRSLNPGTISKPLGDLFHEWDNFLHLTGQPLRLTLEDDGSISKLVDW